ncbi:DUF5954 family protein [Streptomyces zingiberis]|uniref:PE-PGRS family protein n=1 Tax=Streptomyces zingiberis TaxID=2053010 RepID=A0ABX1BT26_9ACTN|nr:DUF5954 family protein [Streptomyces zingiberis]NJQ00861.1 PE-PGRS family protein [Streptomyces zingiberis]
MNQFDEQNPAYRTVRVTALENPVAAMADLEAWEAREAYPEIRSAGAPIFGIAVEREEGGWEIRPYFCNTAPQGARDSLGAVFRLMARDLGEAEGDTAVRDTCLKAAERLDWEVIDDMTVLGTRYRIVRAERFIRLGPEGPEPPRPSDPDPAEPGESHHHPDPSVGFVIDTTTATGMSEGILKTELLSMVRAEGTVPDDMRADSRRALHTHPGGVLLPPTFMIAEDSDGHWRPDTDGTAYSPQAARDGVAAHWGGPFFAQFRKMTPELHAEFAAAGARMAEERLDEVTVAGVRYRVARVERLVRVGPDGPETPRPSDFDPEPPIKVHVQQLKEQGLWEEDDEDDEGDEVTGGAEGAEGTGGDGAKGVDGPDGKA